MAPNMRQDMPPGETASERVPLIDDRDRGEGWKEEGQDERSGEQSGGRGFFTVDDAVSGLGVGWFQVLMMLVVGFCALGEGANATVAAFVAPAVKCEWRLTDKQESLLTVWVFVGLLIGAYLWGALADIMGRKVSLMAATVGGILTSTLAAVMPTIGWLEFMFALMGFTFAGQFSGLTYLLEFVPAAHRGMWGVAAGLFWSAGILGNAATAWLVMPWHGWQGLMVITNIPYVVVLLLFPLVPESAHYLTAAGRSEEALKSLRWAARLNGTQLPEGELVVPAVEEDDSENECRHCSSKIGKFLSDSARLVSDSLWLTTLLVMVLYVCANVVYNIILLLTTQIHTKQTSTCEGQVFSLSAEDFREVLIVSSADLAGNVLPVFIIDFIGRKWCGI
ncbi:unnamed protein product [Ostreobium quekettii]|uniref:Major facilitator superfamily (MFS) profile domain-containing protein n=1 Tax=Ostreobium quekettii TaxID=121088 RepID=A0A8S1IMG3_9CHLO|nr:unnamed protein product [Ostreobium quekettii]